ncbi:MAG: hypothetical protein JKY37_20695 [Nannocystaceae bacterium]|nr:hypothetical protein [Nannocystaceae bacterium]
MQTTTWILGALGFSFATGCGADNASPADAGGTDSIGSLSRGEGDAGGESGPAGTTGGVVVTDGDDSGSEGGSAAGGIKFDVGSPDGSLSCDQGMGMEGTHSYIWIANSSQSTVSKINTVTMVEEARYMTRDTPGNPSRTSVALSGNMAVANRSGGVSKFWGDISDCVESNGTPGIQTSAGPADLLAWDQEECRAWYQPFNYATQRPLAWAHGTLNTTTCEYENEKLWTSGGDNNGAADVLLLDGETGVVEEMVTIPGVIGWAQLYGGAVDGDGNFWTVDHNWNGASTLIRVNRIDMSYDTWPVTGTVHYGLTVDTSGRAWLCGSGGASRFDPVPETWTHLAPINTGNALGGCMTDGQGTLWTSAYPDATMVGIDTESVTQVASYPIPSYVHGVSIDFQGNVWGVEFSGDEAFRIDPATGSYDTVGGLQGAYTYSDMTGFALSAVGAPSG